MKITAIVGSFREGSFNQQLAHTMKERYKDRFDLEIATIQDLPFFNQDIEENPPQSVLDYREGIKSSEAVIIITPEYNWSIPGVLKNAIDWGTRVDKVFIQKPVMVLGASTGMLGTLRAQLHLRDILSSAGVQARLLPPGKNELLVTLAEKKFKDGKLVDEDTLKFIDQKIDNFMEWIESN